MINLTDDELNFIQGYESYDQSTDINYYLRIDRPDLALHILASAGVLDDPHDDNPIILSLSKKVTKVNFSTHVINRVLKQAVIARCPQCNGHEFYHIDDFYWSDFRSFMNCYNGCDTKLEFTDYSRSKTFNKYLELITSQPKRPWTESDVRGLRKSLGYFGTLADDKDLFIDLIECYGPPMIFPEFSDKGESFLKRKYLKLNGELRNTRDQALGERERAILQDFSHFTFDTLMIIYNGHDHYAIFPVYTVHAHNGKSFTYICLMQGGIHVIG